MNNKKPGVIGIAVFVLLATAYGEVVCYKASNNNSIAACGCVIGQKAPIDSMCAFESWSVDDAVCDCGGSYCVQTDATLTAVKNIVVGVCGQNKCNFIDMGSPTSETYNVHVNNGSCPPIP